MKEQGNAGSQGSQDQFANKQEGVFGGLKRVYEGIVTQGNEFKRVPEAAKRDA